MSQFSLACSVYRGGTSRGLFFQKKDLPQDLDLQRKIFIHGIDAYNPSQINGLGSGTSHTSKVVVVAPSTYEEADVDYTFYQIGIGEEIVDDHGTCGNLVAAVGAFAIDEGLVITDTDSSVVTVSVYNTNIKKLFRLQVPVLNGKAKVSGDYLMPGVVTPGAKVIVDILNPGGCKTGKTLPSEATIMLKVNQSIYETSFVDVINPFVYVSADSLGLTANDLYSDLDRNSELQYVLEEIRCRAAVASNIVETLEEGRNLPSIPKIAIVMEPQDYVTRDGREIKKEEVDICAKMVSMGRFHRTFAASGLYNLAAALLLKGTVPNKCNGKMHEIDERLVRIGHPEGIVNVRVSLTEDRKDIAFVGMDRTARKIMKGELFIPNHI